VLAIRMSLSFGFRKSARKWRREKLGQCRSKLPRILCVPKTSSVF
jgi:hypothetical protein